MDATKREEVFDELVQAGIGQTQPLFYRAWAKMLQARGAHADAVAVLERGMSRCADRKRLQQALEEARTHLPRARVPLAPTPQVIAPAPVVAPSPAPGGARPAEQAGYNRALVSGRDGAEVSFEERRAELHVARAAARAAAEAERRRREEEEAAAAGAADEVVMEDEDDEGRMSDASVTIQTGLLTVNTLMAMEDVAQMWRDPISLERKPAIAAVPIVAAPPPKSVLAPSRPALAPVAARAAPALCIYEDPSPSPMQPSAWIASQITRPAVAAAIAKILSPSAAPLPALQRGAELKAPNLGLHSINVTQPIRGSAWRGFAWTDSDDGTTTASDVIALRSGPRAPLVWYAYMCALLASGPTRATDLVQPLALLEHRDTAVLAMAFRDQPTLADVAAVFRQRKQPVDELVAAAIAVEMLVRVEELHRCGVVHGQLERLSHWQLAWDGAAADAWRPGGWPGRGVRLLDWSQALPVADIAAAALAPPATHPLAALLPAKWSVHIDCLSLALALHELLFDAPLRPRTAPDGAVQADLPTGGPVPRRLAADWGRVFAMLLSVRSAPPALSAVRGVLEAFLAPSAARIKPAVQRFKLLVVEDLEKQRSNATD